MEKTKIDIEMSQITELDDRHIVERKLRHLLFMAHGNEEHYLYGDDGERSCNTCMIDFNKDSPDEIEQKFSNYSLMKIARLRAEGKWPPATHNPHGEV